MVVLLNDNLLALRLDHGLLDHDSLYAHVLLLLLNDPVVVHGHCGDLLLGVQLFVELFEILEVSYCFASHGVQLLVHNMEVSCDWHVLHANLQFFYVLLNSLGSFVNFAWHEVDFLILDRDDSRLMLSHSSGTQLLNNSLNPDILLAFHVVKYKLLVGLMNFDWLFNDAFNGHNFLVYFVHSDFFQPWNFIRPQVVNRLCYWNIDAPNNFAWLEPLHNLVNRY